MKRALKTAIALTAIGVAARVITKYVEIEIDFID